MVKKKNTKRSFIVRILIATLHFLLLAITVCAFDYLVDNMYKFDQLLVIVIYIIGVILTIISIILFLLSWLKLFNSEGYHPGW